VNIVIYDLETTGLSTRFDQPIQFAAVRLDSDFREIQVVNLLARPQNHVVASPAALATVGRGIDEIRHECPLPGRPDHPLVWSEWLLRVEPPRFGVKAGRSGYGASFPFPFAPAGSAN
jgi:hypothetical protein